MSAPVNLWSDLINMDRHVDSLIERVRRAVEPTQPISREIPFFGSIENRFIDLPPLYASVVPPGSDVIAGSNIKTADYTNHGSRVYVRELSLHAWQGKATTQAGGQTYDDRLEVILGRFPINYHWNFRTSITDKWYAAYGRMLAAAGGRSVAGTHLAFREPLIIEPMETFQFECELLSFGQATGGTNNIATVQMTISGYREGM